MAKTILVALMGPEPDHILNGQRSEGARGRWDPRTLGLDRRTPHRRPFGPQILYRCLESNSPQHSERNCRDRFIEAPASHRAS